MSDFFVLSTDRARKNAAARCLSAPDGWAVRFQESTRSLESNARMWAMLTDISRQVLWPVWMGNVFVDQRLSKDDWKEILSAGVKQSQRMVKSVEGSGFVMLGESTSRMTKGQMQQLTDFIQFFGDERQVVWTPADEG